MPDPSATLQDLVISDIEGRDISDALSRLGVANPNPADQVRTGGAPGKVSGLALSAVGGAIEIRWNAVTSQDLSHYEIQIATANSFANALTFQAPSSAEQFVHQPADTATRYIRIRAVNQAGTPGPFDLVLNTTTGGTVSTLQLATTSATSITTYNQDFGFIELNVNPLANATALAAERYGPVTVVVPDSNTIVIPFLYLEYEIATVAPAAPPAGDDIYVQFHFYRRAVGSGELLLQFLQVDIRSNIGDVTAPRRAKSVAPTFAPIDIPGAGTWEYLIDVTAAVKEDAIDTGNHIRYLGTKVRFQFLSLKR